MSILPKIPKLLDEKQAGELIDYAPSTLQNMRMVGEGPKYLKFRGRVRYTEELLAEWVNSRVVGSTAEGDALNTKEAKDKSDKNTLNAA